MVSMMVSIMPFCTKPHKRQLLPLWRVLLLLVCSFLMPAAAHADGIAVDKVSVEVSDNSYQVTADFGIRMNFVVEQALTHGVPIYFSSELTLKRPRWYWFDEEIAQSEQNTKLSYNMLTRQYRITRGSLYQNFDSLDEVLRVFGHQVFPPVDAARIPSDSKITASVRMRLDVSQLPKPLQVNALATKDWDLDSGWHHWTLNTDILATIKGKEE